MSWVVGNGTTTFMIMPQPENYSIQSQNDARVLVLTRPSGSIGTLRCSEKSLDGWLADEWSIPAARRPALVAMIAG